eukprot:SAG22_NODE_1280_length_4899_cov_5.374792_1_plen_199_part_10
MSKSELCGSTFDDAGGFVMGAARKTAEGGEAGRRQESSLLAARPGGGKSRAGWRRPPPGRPRRRPPTGRRPTMPPKPRRPSGDGWSSSCWPGRRQCNRQSTAWWPTGCCRPSAGPTGPSSSSLGAELGGTLARLTGRVDAAPGGGGGVDRTAVGARARTARPGAAGAWWARARAAAADDRGRGRGARRHGAELGGALAR